MSLKEGASERLDSSETRRRGGVAGAGFFAFSGVHGRGVVGAVSADPLAGALGAGVVGCVASVLPNGVAGAEAGGADLAEAGAGAGFTVGFVVCTRSGFETGVAGGAWDAGGRAGGGLPVPADGAARGGVAGVSARGAVGLRGGGGVPGL